MYRTDCQQNKINGPNQLFYLPKNIYKRKEHSQNFIKLFKHALNRVSLDNKTPKRQMLPNRKISLQQVTLKSKTRQQEIVNKEKQIIIENESALDILSERKRLVKQIMNEKTYMLTLSKKRQSISRRCQTLETNNIQKQQIKIDQDMNSGKKIKMPVKIRLAYSKNKYRKNLESNNLPLIQKNSQSPLHSKKLAIQTLDVIKNYRQLQNEYRAKQHLYIPFSITSMYSPIRKESQKEGRISSMIKNSLIQSKNKIRYSLKDSSRQNMEFRTRDPQNLNHQVLTNARNSVEQDLQILRLIRQGKGKGKVEIQREYLSSNKEPYFQQIPKKLKYKSPPDEYFRPWEHSEQIKDTNNLVSPDLFYQLNTTNTDQNQNGQCLASGQQSGS